jgi:hypothetical protein
VEAGDGEGEATALRKGLAELPGEVSDGRKEAAADAKVKLQTVETGGVEGSPVNQPCSRYDPIQHACWKAGKPAPYLHLAWASELLCATTKRLAKVMPTRGLMLSTTHLHNGGRLSRAHCRVKTVPEGRYTHVQRYHPNNSIF